MAENNPNPPNPAPPANNPPPAPDLMKEFETLKAKYADLEKRVASPTPPPEDPTLLEKARLERENQNKRNSDLQALEKALTFSLKADDFIKTNSSLLPKDVEDIFKQASKENYGSAIEKDAAIKSGIIQSFFAVQANVDLLTPGLKTSLDDYLKLTKNGKQEKAQSVYDGIFEPAFEMLKRIKKAEALGKGYGAGDDADTLYKKKMTELSKRHYLGEKSNGT
jgi:hypothetical protein